MKFIKYIYSFAFIVMLLLIVKPSFSQEIGVDVIKRAMQDELSRSIEKLKIEGLQKPFFISYRLSDANTLCIKSSLGSIIKSDEKPYRKQGVRVMVGDYKSNNENYVDINNMSFGSGGSVPIEDDYYGIRRSLWKSTDRNYKDAAESYEAKISALKQQNLSEEEAALNDFTKSGSTKINIPSQKFDIDKKKWENTAKELSAIFSSYNQIFSSNVNIYLYNCEVFYVNSEGTETKLPVTIAAVQINAKTMADDGAPLFDHLLYYASNPDDLPGVDQMKKEIKAMADNLVMLTIAPVFDDSYSGPVLFEGQSVGEVFAQKYFSGANGLITLRKPLFSDPRMAGIMGQALGQTLESKMDKKILAKEISITSNPFMKEYNGIKLIGSFEIDAEGVKPANELVLVEKGILKSMINDRIPTPKMQESTGYCRYALASGGGISPEVGPGVIKVSSELKSSKAELKKQLIEAAKEEDLDYAIIVRKIESLNSGIEKDMNESSLVNIVSGGGNKGALSKAIQVYKVNLEDGSETLVRSAQLGGMSTSTLKKILGMSDTEIVYNTLLSKSVGGMSFSIFSFRSSGDSWSLGGIPATFIVPDAMLVEYMDVQKEKRAITEKLPIVKNPVGLK